MTQVDIKYLEDKDGNKVAPITHVNAVRDSNGDTLPEILDRDYPTTSKTPVEGSSEVSLVTRGEKYDYDKVNNATSISSASGIGANLKYILLNGTTGEFEAALGSYVEEKVRSALGGLLHNLNKASVSSANLDVACIEHIPADANAGTPESYDFGSLSAAQLASVLGVEWDGQDSTSDGNLSVLVNRNIFGKTHALGAWSGAIYGMGLGVYTISNMKYVQDVPASLAGSSNGCMLIRTVFMSDGSAVCTLLINMDTGAKWVRPADNVAWVSA